MAIGDLIGGSKPGYVLVVGDGGRLAQVELNQPPDYVSLFIGPRIQPAGTSIIGSGMEIGVKFIPLVNGTIVGWALWKQPDDAATGHTGTLWTIEGSAIVSKASSGEPVQGWVQKLFDTPAAVSANTTYVISVFLPTGNFGYIPYFFNTSYSNWPLTVLSSADAGGNGIYNDSGVSAFPSQTFHSTFYMVDVLFKPATP